MMSNPMKAETNARNEGLRKFQKMRRMRAMKKKMIMTLDI